MTDGMTDGLMGRIPTIWEAFLSGALSFVSPCVIALIPVALIYVAGVSLERRSGAGESPDAPFWAGWRLKASLLSHLGSFLAGFIFVLVGMAAGETFVGRVFLLGQRALTVAGGLLVAVMGVFMTGLVARSRGDLRLRFRHRFLGYLSSAAVGGTYGLVWSPCVGPTLGSLILAAGSADTSDQGIPLLIVHGLGFGIPFLVTGLLIDLGLQAVRAPRLALILEKTAGGLMAAAGILIAAGKFLAFTDGLFQAFDFWVQVLIKGGL